MNIASGEPGGREEGHLVLAGPVEAEIEVRRSRFVARLERVDSEEAARAVVDAARRTHWDARHHCSAFVLGAAGTAGRVERSSDDGEPPGTAGAPILDALTGAGLGDAVAVVTRWFGGTLLGGGGLVRAYGGAVREALAQARFLRRTPVRRLALDVDLADAGRVENDLRARGHRLGETAYGTRATLTLELTSSRLEAARADVARATGGTASLRDLGAGWIDLAV